MKHYFFRLLPPRPTFMADITPAEARLMQEHAAYWKSLLARNIPIVFGPVVDPRGPFGICVFRAEDEPEARALVQADPTLRAASGFSYELFPMANAVYRE